MITQRQGRSHAVEPGICARSCYDHLAGRLGVAVTDALVARKVIVPSRPREYRLTARGDRFLSGLGVDVERAHLARRNFAGQCLDWSGRRPHLAGALGAGLRDLFLSNGWVRRAPGSRTLRITDLGRIRLKEMFALEV
jgi:hypothetical protein